MNTEQQNINIIQGLLEVLEQIKKHSKPESMIYHLAESAIIEHESYADED